LRLHLHLKPAQLEPLLALSEATIARRSRERASLDLLASERLDCLIEVISLAYGVFEQPASTEAWLKLLTRCCTSKVRCSTAAPPSGRARCGGCCRRWSRADRCDPGLATE
jgi:hypothetical protein